MGWQSVSDRAVGTEYEASSKELVQKVETQLQAIERFLEESRQSAVSDPHLGAMRADIEKTYNQARQTLAYLGDPSNTAQISTFQQMGGLASVSEGLSRVVSPDDMQGRTAINDYKRALDVPNEDEAKAITDPEALKAYISERRTAFANRVDEFTTEASLNARFAEASTEHLKSRANPAYTPDPARSFEAIAGEGAAGKRMVSLNNRSGSVVSLDPVDKDALAMYGALDALKRTAPSSLDTISPALRDEIAEINMNVVGRAYAGKYGPTFALQSGQDKIIEAGPDNINNPRTAYAIGRSAGGTYNPLDPIMKHNAQGDVTPENKMPGNTYNQYSQFATQGLSAQNDQLPERNAALLDRMQSSGGERVPSADIYKSLGLNPSGPDFSAPPIETSRRIQETISDLDSKVSLLEQVVANPTGADIQKILAERGMTVDSLLVDLKKQVGQNPYQGTANAEAFQRSYDAANIDRRVESLLGVPIDQSQNTRFNTSPALQALSRNFEHFHPTPPNQPSVPQTRDGANQLGEALEARGGAIVMDNHLRPEAVNFLRDSLPEIASRGSAKILIENADNTRTVEADGLVMLNQNNPLEQYYATGDASHLQGLKSSYTAHLENIAERRALTPAEQIQLGQLRERDAATISLIEEAYTQHGIKCEFLGGPQEGKVMENYGLEARGVSTDFGWDQQIRDARKEVDNVIVFGGGNHFAEDLTGRVSSGRKLLDESLGYPTFSAGDTQGRFKGNYHVDPGSGDRWISTPETPTAPKPSPTAEFELRAAPGMK